MKEIKFRAWDEEEGMIYGLNKIFLEYDGHKGNPERLFQTIPLMQYTGLNDKNGKEIYEGDIISTYQQVPRKTISDKFQKITQIGEVIYEAPSFSIILQNKEIKTYLGNWIDFDDFAEPYEIIGNIFENPERLK